MRIRRGHPPRLHLEPVEVQVLGNLLGELRPLIEGNDPAGGDDAFNAAVAELTGEPADSGAVADDPVRSRLLPDAYRDDEEAAADWRRFGRSEVRSAKLRALERVEADIADRPEAGMPLNADRVGPWLATLTDLRLALGTRLGVEEDWAAQASRLPADHPALPSYAVYSWLSELQESILEAI